MKIPNELVTEWFLAAQEQSTVTKSEYIAQRAAEWALIQPVSMEPVAWTGTRASIPHLTSSRAIAEREADLYTIPLYTAAQLAAARQQGAEDQTDKTLEAVRVASERIAELEKSNAVLLEALKRVRKMCTPELSHQETLMCKVIDAAIAEVKP